jgi:hypothetical protein
MAKAGEKVHALEEILFARFHEMNRSIDKICDHVSSQAMPCLADSEEENATEEYLLQKAHEDPYRKSAGESRRPVCQGLAKIQCENIRCGHRGDQQHHGKHGKAPAGEKIAQPDVKARVQQSCELGWIEVAVIGDKQNHPRNHEGAGKRFIE